MLNDLLNNQSLLIVCGSGGVGKTTTSASLALEASLQGKKAIVVTIDPAKRLATALGLKELSDKPQKIDLKNISEKPPQKGGEFWASMLNPKTTFDELVERYSPSQEIKDKILGNTIYQHVSNMIAGSQEYMAMEKLYEMVESHDYDLVIIDTPPTTHALDFLESPQKMLNALKHSMIHFLLKPSLFFGKSALGLFGKGANMMTKIFDRIIGFAFLQEVSEMLISFQELLGGFEKRAEQVQEILRAKKTSFLLVTVGEEKSIGEAAFFCEKVDSLNLPLASIILNRTHPHYRITPSARENQMEELNQKFGKKLGEKMRHEFDLNNEKAKEDLTYQKQLQALLKKEQFLVPVPLFESDIHDLDSLHRLGQNLLQS